MTASGAAGPGYGNHRLVVGVEIAGIDTLADDGKRRARSIAFDVIENAFKLAGIPAGRRTEEVRGNGLVAVLEPVVTPTDMLGYWVEHVHQELRHRNGGRQPRVQLRIGMEFGTVYLDGRGPAGAGVDLACALRDSAPAVRALQLAPAANLVLAVSDHLYRSSVQAEGPWIEPERYTAAPVTGSGLDTQAWFYVPRHPAPLFPVADGDTGRPGEPARSARADEPVPAGEPAPPEQAPERSPSPRGGRTGGTDSEPSGSPAREAKYHQVFTDSSFRDPHFGDSYQAVGTPEPRGDR